MIMMPLFQWDVQVSTNTDVGGGEGRGGKVVSEVRGREEWLNGVG